VSSSAVELRRALFLSGSLGKGHDVVAEACGAALAERGVDYRIVDSMALLGGGASAVGEWVFRRLLSVNAVYDAFHFSQLRDDGRLGRVADRAAVTKMHRALAAEIAEFAPQLVVPVFATGAGAAAKLREERPELRSMVIMTDSFAHRMWVHERTDLFLVTSAAAAESVRRYWPEARVRVVTAPVRPEFYRAPAQADARAALGVAPGRPCVLLISGAWGIGPLDEAASALAADGLAVLAVAGSNAALERRVRAAAQKWPTIVPFGYTDRVPELMSAADVVVTSSGDTCREARTMGRSIILLDVVPGHGRENLMHELELGGASACSPTPESIRRSVASFLADPERSQALPAEPAGHAEAQFLDAVQSLGFSLPSGAGAGPAD
jgi:UDP-N-acetylglucosamine:LPS N-acetylglucosamine transferase